MTHFVSEYSETDRELFIDLFINRRKEFHEVGKWAIAASILYHEVHSTYGDEIDSPDKDWMSVLFTALTNEIYNDDFKRILENDIFFVTFNYDRSLEYSLHRSMQRNFGASEEDAAEIVSKIPIVHVYGQIAALPWQSKDGLEFQPDLEKVDPRKYSKDLQIMYGLRATKSGKEAKSMIQAADSLCFMGFGYAPENLEAIGIPEILKPSQIINGTAYQMSLLKTNQAARSIRGDKLSKRNVKIDSEMDSAALVRYLWG